MKDKERKPLLQMRKNWDEMAKEDATKHIASGRGTWKINDFFLSGEADIERICMPFFESRNFNPDNKRMLEIGCGIGRMTRKFADLFGEVYAIDVSPEMIRKAREMNKDKTNIKFSECNGEDLSLCAEDSFDFIFSYVVFRHIPRIAIIAKYISEINRVLKTNGLFQLEFNPHVSRVLGVPIPLRVYNSGIERGWIFPLLKFYKRGEIDTRKLGVRVSTASFSRMIEPTELKVHEFKLGANGLWVMGEKGSHEAVGG